MHAWYDVSGMLHWWNSQSHSSNFMDIYHDIRLVNFSLSQHTIPRVWKIAHVNLVPKTLPVTGYGDLRPIPVTWVLSRTVYKLVVKNYLTLVLYCPLFHNQYAYKPTGYTTCALADFTYHIHMLLESNQLTWIVYVLVWHDQACQVLYWSLLKHIWHKHKLFRCVLINFSKAFDMLDHAILAHKLFSLQVPGFIIHYIISFSKPS